MTEPETRRIAIVEDDPLVQDHFVEIIAGTEGLSLHSVSGTIEAAGALLSDPPDLVLCDIGLPDGSGLDFVPRLKAATSARALVITSFGDRDTVVTALRAGADGYLLKDSSIETIRDGIAATLEGGSPVSPAAAVYLLDMLRRPQPAPLASALPANASPPPAAEALTPRETELLQLFARGQSYKEAARSLDISPLTVGNHVKSIYRKLEVRSRGEAVWKALGVGGRG